MSKPSLDISRRLQLYKIGWHR